MCTDQSDEIPDVNEKFNNMATSMQELNANFNEISTSMQDVNEKFNNMATSMQVLHANVQKFASSEQRVYPPETHKAGEDKDNQLCSLLASSLTSWSLKRHYPIARVSRLVYYTGIVCAFFGSFAHLLLLSVSMQDCTIIVFPFHVTTNELCSQSFPLPLSIRTKERGSSKVETLSSGCDYISFYFIHCTPSL
ncbi:uncharacterized protein LOC142476818 isoform X2 [Ascaphus truei]|uniref:uncharacterized protein LOC142476818 isoform X2 n=1 Tax=Ascaphus truei TaxID=8439 RepID=UPI003F5A64C0